MNSNDEKSIISAELEGVLPPENSDIALPIPQSKLLIKYSGDDVMTVSCVVGTFDGVRLDVDGVSCSLAFLLLNNTLQNKRAESVTLQAYGQEFPVVFTSVNVYGIYGETCSITFNN